MTNLRIVVLWLVALIALGYVNYSIYQQEALTATGEVILLEIGPRDPRSLIQGDYMTLRYRMAMDLPQSSEWPRRGKLVVKKDANEVATFVRVHDGEALAADERLLNYHKRGEQIYIGAESFFFQEGEAETFAKGRFVEMRVDPSGEGLIVGMRDETFRLLGQDQKVESPLSTP